MLVEHKCDKCGFALPLSTDAKGYKGCCPCPKRECKGTMHAKGCARVFCGLLGGPFADAMRNAGKGGA